MSVSSSSQGEQRILDRYIVNISRRIIKRIIRKWGRKGLKRVSHASIGEIVQTFPRLRDEIASAESTTKRESNHSQTITSPANFSENG